MDKTKCYSYFSIQSAGEIRSISENLCDFFAFENSDFDPDNLTSFLNINPFKAHKMNEPIKNGKKNFRFSLWNCCLQEEPAYSAEEQCLNIVRYMKPYIPKLIKVKEKYNVSFTIIIVPHVYNEDCPFLYFNKEIIEFCYLTGTEISVDMYVYDKE